MKKILPYFLMLIPMLSIAQTFDLDRDWGTYFGDERFIYRDSKTDTEHNLYVAGYVIGGVLTDVDPETGEETEVDYGDVTENFDYFINAPHQSVHAGGGTDGFVAKFSPDGSLLWATFFGGESQDFIEAIDIDSANNLYIYGSTDSTTGISTVGAYQEEKAELFDLFLVKFSPQGTLVWGTYFGGEENERSLISSHNSTIGQMERFIVHDGDQHLYLNASLLSPSLITLDNTGTSTLLKFTDSGQPVWVTTYGINGSTITGLAFCSNALFVAGYTNDTPGFPNFNNTYFASEGAFQSTQGGGFLDAFLAKFSVQGERVWGTYFGGSSVELMSFNSLACKDKFLYLGGRTNSNGMATNDAFQVERDGSTTPFLVKFEDNISQVNGLVPIREWSTYYGFGGEVNSTRPISVTVDDKGAVYLSGNTGLTGNIASEGAWQDSPLAGIRSGFLAKFNAQGSRAWGTYYRGESHSQWEKVLPYETNGDDKFYLTGVTLSNTGMATESALQQERQVFNTSGYQGNNFGIFIAHFSPLELSVDEFSRNTIMLYPNPNQGSFTLKLESLEAEAELLMYDVQGRQVHQQKVYETETFVTTSSLSEGVYFLKLVTEHKTVYAGKIIISNH